MHTLYNVLVSLQLRVQVHIMYGLEKAVATESDMVLYGVLLYWRER